MTSLPGEEHRQALAAESPYSSSRAPRILRRAEASLQRVPYLKRVPPPALGIIALLALVNVAVWVGVAIVLVSMPPTGDGPAH